MSNNKATELKIKDKSGMIQRRRYNTRTAKLIKTYENEGWTESLYRKKTGEFFLYGWGVNFPKGMISPLENDEAEKWIDNKFGMNLQDLERGPKDALVMMSLNVPNWLREALRNKASDEKTTISSIMVDAISESVSDYIV